MQRTMAELDHDQETGGMRSDIRPDVLLTIPAPTQWLNANHRKHWAVKSRDVKLWRDVTAVYARQAGIRSYGDLRVRIEATCHMKTARNYDAGNYYPTAKACVDGLRDAWVLVDDDNAHVIGPDMRAGDKWVIPSLVLRIEIAP